MSISPRILHQKSQIFCQLLSYTNYANPQPHTSRFFVGRQKNLHLSASVRWIQTSLQKDRGLSGDIWKCLISKCLVGPCRLVCGGPRPFVGPRAHLNQWGIVMRVTWTSVSYNMGEIDSAPSLNAVNRDKISASVRQADVATNFNLQKNCSSATKNRLVCVCVGGYINISGESRPWAKRRGRGLVVLFCMPCQLFFLLWFLLFFPKYGGREGAGLPRDQPMNV